MRLHDDAACARPQDVHVLQTIATRIYFGEPRPWSVLVACLGEILRLCVRISMHGVLTLASGAQACLLQNPSFGQTQKSSRR